jgi:threonine aldolase
MNFNSDNVYGVHPRILESLAKANSGTTPSYGSDDLSRAAEERLSEVFERPVRAFLLMTGTAANGLALSTISPGYGAVICHNEAHVYCDECNGPEFYTGGAKLIGVHGPGGKITPSMIDKVLQGFIRGANDPKPRGVSIANATELGTVYSPAEVKAIADLAHGKGLKLHMDGARFANALAGFGCTAAELTWKAGLDVMSFGATKNGAMMLEAVVFFDLSLAADFDYRRMRAGQRVSKSRYLGAQMLAYLENGLWLENAKRANGLARKLSEGLKAINSVRIPNPVQANEVFAVMPKALNDRLLKAGAHFHDWMPDSLGGAISSDEIFTRFVLSFATLEEDVDKFLKLASSLG